MSDDYFTAEYVDAVISSAGRTMMMLPAHGQLDTKAVCLNIWWNLKI